MAEIAAVAGLGAAGVGISAMLIQGDPINEMLVLRFSDGEFDENATKIFQSRLQNDSKFRQVAIAMQSEFEKLSRTPGGAQTAGRRAKRLEMVLRRNPARPAQGLSGKQGPGSERQLKGQQGGGTQKTPGPTASQELRGPQGQSSIQGRTLSPRGHGKAD
ncbi:hypothetical protein GJ744_009998 [Endocarpon pusillum]|uniref:Uncharacterized protein n=1 Tax=Endocarpon pusillum TaxID=364733 RepID=A0A8H7E273_9EURO|nr:hypothetical protein GJ744_009998 [Endocarpon pusillum]